MRPICWVSVSRTAHQRHAQHAPFAFVSGQLFSADILAVYARLTLPVWVTQCTRGSSRGTRALQWAQGRDNWSGRLFDTGALPHFEQPEAFLEAYLQFLAAPTRGPPALRTPSEIRAS
jgi:hypothetical protein